MSTDYLKGFLDGTKSMTGHILDIIEQGEKKNKELHDMLLKTTKSQVNFWKRKRRCEDDKYYYS